jgi:hypothetical protein
MTRTNLQKMLGDFAGYREAVGHVLAERSQSVERWRILLEALQLSTATLYLDYLQVTRPLADLNLPSRKRFRKKPINSADDQHALRARFREHLESTVPWQNFRSGNPFSSITNLRSKEDYLQVLALHVPEIYQETLVLEPAVSRFLQEETANDQAMLIVGLQHLGRNHISFLLPALEWITDESSWDVGDY